MRRRRKYHTRKAYDVCFRAVKGLPLPARDLTTLLIESAVARTLALTGAILSNYVWMANHPHMQLYSLDMQAFADLHGQLKKRLTDSIKRLLNLDRLNLWVDRTTSGEVLDLEAAIQRIIYMFTNPVRALQSTTIDLFRGCNTWKEFLSVDADVNAFAEKNVHWIRASDIEPLSRRNPSLTEERWVIERLKGKAQLRLQTLKVYPFKWLEPFGIINPIEIEKIRQRIIREVREVEASYADTKFPEHGVEGYVVTDEYTPRKKEGSIFMYGSEIALRISALENHNSFSAECRECFLQMKAGHTSIAWPPECFVPQPPRICNPIC